MAWPAGRGGGGVFYVLLFEGVLDAASSPTKGPPSSLGAGTVCGDGANTPAVLLHQPHPLCVPLSLFFCLLRILVYFVLFPFIFFIGVWALALRLSAVT